MGKQKEEILVIHQMIRQNNGDPNWIVIGEKIGKSAEAARSFYRRHKKKYVGETSELEANSIQIKEDGSQVSDRLIALCEEERKDPKRLLELHNYDPDEWVLVHARDNLWHMMKSHKVGGGNALLYQSRIVAKPKDGSELTLEDVDTFFDGYEPEAKSKPRKMRQYDPGAEVLEIDLADIHWGKRIFGFEEIGLEEKFRYTIEDILVRCKGRKFSKIYLLNLGDLFHFDTKKRTTSNGTGIETDGSTLPEIFDKMLELFFWAIDALSEIAPVEYIHISGNHDWFSSYAFAKSIECYYRNNKNVIVDTGHKPRKWRLIGVSLVGFSHGDMYKTNAFSWLMSEAREEWGKSKYAEVHSGHIHSQKTEEKHGMILRHVPSMAGTDEWHYEKGYVGNVQSTTSYVWHPKYGLRDIWYTNILTGD